MKALFHRQVEMAANNERRFMRSVLILLLVPLCTTACTEEQSLPEGDEGIVYFNYDSTLVEHRIADASLRIRFAAPLGWKAVPAAVGREVALKMQAQETRARTSLNLRHIFVEPERGCVFMLSSYDAENGIELDDEMNRFNTAYRERYGMECVQTTAFYTRDFQVSQALVNAPEFVVWRFVLRSAKTPPLDLLYFIPRAHYENV